MRHEQGVEIGGAIEQVKVNGATYDLQVQCLEQGSYLLDTAVTGE